jgi:hypothetical protein
LSFDFDFEPCSGFGRGVEEIEGGRGERALRREGEVTTTSQMDLARCNNVR